MRVFEFIDDWEIEFTEIMDETECARFLTKNPHMTLISSSPVVTKSLRKHNNKLLRCLSMLSNNPLRAK